ncbi:hypothetical protein TH61_17080 [Rufibacter sp. DG15C]|nr:hypothetical protein TH61_17080 [Rufibacter sp. DG15C]
MQRIASALAKAGYAVSLVGRALPASLPLDKTDFTQTRLTCFFHTGPLFYLEFNLRLFFWILKASPDILGIVDADTALAGVMAAKLKKMLVTYDAHELFPEMPEVVHRPLVKKIWGSLEELAFKRADRAYTVSTSLASYFQDKYHMPVGLVRNMPWKVSTNASEQEPPYFIYQGALNVGRGLECLLHAMQGVEVHLMICGIGPLEAELKRLSYQLALEGKVQFKGNVPPEDLMTLTQKAKAGIMLLEENGLSYFYSLANKFFDYVHAGIPQVCIAFPEYKALNQLHEVAVLTELEVSQVQAALQSLLHDKELYSQLQQNCLTAREEWNWEKESQALLKIYADV